MIQPDFDAVVVGSGFGAAVAAWRLSEERRRILILERGKRYAPGEFPRDLSDPRKVFWDPESPQDSPGLYDLRFHSGIATLVASGVGGGSLIYANNLVRPDAKVFDRWPEPFRLEMMVPLISRIEAILSPSPVPEGVRLEKRLAFRRAAEELGRDVFDTNQAVSWMVPSNPGQGHCVFCAECEFGCNRGAKNTMDFTFLRRAMAAGASLLASCEVSHVEPSEVTSGGQPEFYRVYYRNLHSNQNTLVTARRVVLAAGTLGTTEILLRSRDLFGTLSHLSPRLGRGFSSNGDFLGTIQHSRVRLDPWYGPDVTSVMRFSDSEAHFTLAAPTFNRPSMTFLASLGQGGPHQATWFSDKAWPHLAVALRAACRLGLVDRPLGLALPGAGPPERMSCLFAIGRDNANGQLLLKNGRLDILWNYAKENRILINAMLDAMRAVGRSYGGTVAPLATWDLFEKTTTVHPLGGCAIGARPDEGVIDVEGQVFGHPGLHVCDGSAIPTAIGYHPALTISAVALKFSDDLVRMAP